MGRLRPFSRQAVGVTEPSVKKRDTDSHFRRQSGVRFGSYGLFDPDVPDPAIGTVTTIGIVATPPPNATPHPKKGRTVGATESSVKRRHGFSISTGKAGSFASGKGRRRPIRGRLFRKAARRTAMIRSGACGFFDGVFIPPPIYSLRDCGAVGTVAMPPEHKVAAEKRAVGAAEPSVKRRGHGFLISTGKAGSFASGKGRRRPIRGGYLGKRPIAPR